MHFLSCAGELNHHGKPVCDSLYNILGGDFIRVTTKEIPESRLNLGFKQSNDTPYNKMMINATSKEIEDIISWADVIDFGAASIEFLNEAIRQNKVVFIRLERLFKEGQYKLLYPPVLKRYYHKYIKNKDNPNVYFLCTSAYAANDLAKLGVKGERVLSWAYCPEFREISETTFKQNSKKLSLVWCGRLISWKHPEGAIKIAAELKKLGCDFQLKILGDGVLKEKLAEKICKTGLQSEVELCGPTPSNMVREIMLESDVFLATSDKKEGWGVVVNEGMSSGCAVFATKEMGAVPTLIKDGENGFYITPGKEAEIAKKIKELSDNPEMLKKYKTAAYETIRDGFSPDVYAKVFVKLAEEAMNGSVLPREGLGGRADII